jgi:6-methylsalicylate decarboxylase
LVRWRRFRCRISSWRWKSSRGRSTTRAVATLLFSGALERHPNIRWHLPHCGGTVPFLAHRLATLLARDPGMASQVVGDPLRLLGQFHVDTAQSHNHPALAATRALVGVERIVLGTDWPYAVLAEGSDPQPELDALGPEIRRAVDRLNALALVPSLQARLTARAL